MKVVALVLVMIACAGIARADVGARVEAAFIDWATATGAQDAALVLLRDGQPIHNVSRGDWTTDKPLEMASLSKAITAVCAAHLMDAGVWDADTTSADVLGTGAPGLAVGAFLTHASGLSPDQTQGFMRRWLDRPGPGPGAAKAAFRALQRPEQTAQPGRYSYNNENYAVLAAMIARATGMTYLKYCKPLVLDAAGVQTAVPSPRTGGFLAWGGWQMSLADYAGFHWHAYGPQGIIGRQVGRWPATYVGNGAWSGMGMFHRPSGGRHTFWHFGGYCMPLRMNLGSYAVIWQQKYSVAVAYDICADRDQMRQLDAALARAVLQ